MHSGVTPGFSPDSCNADAVTVDRITYSRSTGAETWVTSDGRAYFVHLYENAQDDLDVNSATDNNASDSVVHFLHTFILSDNYHRQTSVSVLNDGSGHGSERASMDSIQNQQLLRWDGTCIHDTRHGGHPARNQMDQTHPTPNDAIHSAINAKFSLVAIGTHG